MNILGASRYLWGRVGTSDTSVAELVQQATAAGYTETEARGALALMESASQIVKGRAQDTYQRWHGEIARERAAKEGA